MSSCERQTGSALPFDQRPVIGVSGVFPPNFADPFHAHPYDQLGFSISGVMSVTTETASIVLPPNRAVWIPANTAHETVSRGEVRYQALFIDPRLNRSPKECRVFEISPLLRGLTDAIAAFDTSRPMDNRQARLTDVLLDELARLPDLTIGAAMPVDCRLKRVCRKIVEDPSDRRDINDWAKLAGMSRSTFTRHFRQQTGMGFVMWRRQIRLMEAVSRLSAGEPITTVARQTGYESASAFTAMFHRSVGLPPSSFCKSLAKDASASV